MKGVSFLLLMLVAIVHIYEKGAPTSTNVEKPDADDRGKPLLYCKIAIPEAFLTTSQGLTYGGDIRMGDLTGN